MTENSYPAPPPATASNGTATAAMVIGIIALALSVLFFPLGLLLGVVALIMGIVARRKGGTNRGRATAGIATGAVAILIAGLIAVFVGNFIADNADEISDLTECLEQADGAAEEEDCNRRFEEEIGG